MAEVTPLPRQHKVAFAADPEVVKMLEDALALAREGRIQAFGMAVVYHDDLVPGGEAGSGWALTSGTRFALAYAIQKLHMRFSRHCHIDEDT